MNNRGCRKVPHAIGLLVLAGVAALWAWYTLAELFGLPLVHYRHALAALCLLAILGWGSRPGGVYITVRPERQVNPRSTVYRPPPIAPLFRFREQRILKCCRYSMAGISPVQQKICSTGAAMSRAAGC